MQLGFQNEEDFKIMLDRKKVKDLPTNMQDLLFILFRNINMNSYIECWRSKYLEKADIKIKINGVLKGISIKTGHNCSIHQEHIDKFYNFLLKIGVDNYVIDLFNKYMVGMVNGARVNAATYIKHNEKDINLIRETFNNYYIKINLIMRFLFQGTEIQKYDCDAIIYGTPNNFLWATKEEVLKFLIEFPDQQKNYINISALNIKCYDRNLRNIPERKKGEKCIQIKWYTLKEDLLNIAKNRLNNSKKKHTIGKIT